MKKVYICFDYDNDLFLKEALVAQSKLDDSPFSISDVSIKQEIESNWQVYARQRIKNSDIVVVMCGHNTHSARGVAIELEIARQEGKPYFMLCGYSDGRFQRPSNAQGESVYEWTWPNLKILIGRAA